MKQNLLIGAILLLLTFTGSSQITSPVIRAAFGVDADLRTNYFNGFVQSGNDDWFNNGTAGTGKFVIDTTGAAAIVAGYMSDVAPYPRRMTPIYRGMTVPQFTVVNNRLWYDALWVRDHHGKDSTVFSGGSNKNGDNPSTWTGGVQSVPDKNDILDVFMHMRRAGPNITDSLWMFCALSLDNVTGNRYFDFELYQTDIYYDRGTMKWYGYGPDLGHTSWKFDAAGNVIQAGDVIFTASFQSSSLSVVEARIWVSKADWTTVVPSQFNWGGLYDGASTISPYGYASILPSSAGIFYTGLGSGNNTWAGPFQLVLQDNSVVANYAKDQFMEFSVNLTKLGIDPANLFGADFCGAPFNRLVVKTRSSESFTSELKDFIAPLDLFLAPRADVAAEVPIFCVDTATSYIYVTNPIGTSIYTWTTDTGSIISSPTGPWIQVNKPGKYYVTQRLTVGCNPYAIDSAVVVRNNCGVLSARFKSFSASYDERNRKSELRWTIFGNISLQSSIVERSIDGNHFSEAGNVLSNNSTKEEVTYTFIDELSLVPLSYVDYRIKIVSDDGTYSYSKVIRIYIKTQLKIGMTVNPNPVKNNFQLTINSSSSAPGKIIFLDMYGRTVMTKDENIKQGVNVLAMGVNENWQPGVYNVILKLNHDTYRARFVLIE